MIATMLLIIAGALLVLLGVISKPKNRRDRATQVFYITMGYFYVFLALILKDPNRIPEIKISIHDLATFISIGSAIFLVAKGLVWALFRTDFMRKILMALDAIIKMQESVSEIERMIKEEKRK